MKKIFMMAAAVALVLASCGNKAQNNAAQADSTSVATDSAAANNEAAGTGQSAATLSSEAQTTVSNLTQELQKAVAGKDSKAAIATLANLLTIYKNMVEQGKLEEAKQYGSAIKQFVNENAASIKQVADGNATIANLVEGIKNLPTSSEATAEQAKAAITSDVAKLASPTIAKGATVVESAKAAAEAVKNAPAAVKTAAENAATKAVSDAENKAKEKVSSDIQKANEKTATKVNEAKSKAAQKVNDAKSKANDAVNQAANKALKGLGL